MNAVLPTPNLPALINLEDLQAYIDSEIKKGIEKALPAAVEKVLSDPENPILIRAIDNILVFSEHNILKRILGTEKVTGIYKYEDFEEHIPTIPERIEALEQRTVLVQEKPTEEKKDENPIIAKTTLTQKAIELTEYLEKKTKANWSGKIVLENQDIYKFFREIIQEDLRWPERIRGYRGAKKSIIERAQELFPDKVEVVRNKSGNKITGLALKPFSKRTDTYAC
jgi:hypothetical protein